MIARAIKKGQIFAFMRFFDLFDHGKVKNDLFGGIKRFSDFSEKSDKNLINFDQVFV